MKVILQKPERPANHLFFLEEDHADSFRKFSHFQGVEIHPPKVGNSGEVLIPDP